MASWHRATRRSLLKSSACAVIMAGTLRGADAAAAGTMAKNSVQYQDTPKDSHQCDGCALYIAGASATAPGQCRAVAGPIDPHGWCMLWSAKS
ncbi:MAG: high-potential iron-sulfur protein [Rhodospirillales bacterium]|nr:high-potential iron-sulfur protein [Rhodospirillales bacterium]